MRYTNFAFLLVLATTIMAYPVWDSSEDVVDVSDMGDVGDDEFDEFDDQDDYCPGPVPTQSNSYQDPRPHYSSTYQQTYTSTSILTTSVLTSAKSASTATGSTLSNPLTVSARSSSTTTISTGQSVPTFSTSMTTSAAATSTLPTPGSLRGVNIGNWLVIEPWMDDGSLMTGKSKNAPDQWTFDSLDTDGSAIKAHWDSWFTQADVQRLKGYGFNALRIPIGFWAFNNNNTPYRKGAADYMDKAIVWARNAGMKVLIDCHGSPGSQNGQMHSGHQGAIKWQQDNNLELSTQILQQMVQRWGTIQNADTVFAIEIVNEPTANPPNSFSTSQSWAADTYKAMQSTISDMGLNKNLQIITHDSFMGITKFIPIANELVSPVNVPTFGVDQHDYQLYTSSDNALDQPAHIKKACGWANDLATTKSSMPVYVGEWSALTNICVDSNGNTSAASAGNTGSCTTSDPKSWSPQLVQQVRRYVEAQLDVYEANSDGHFIWSLKAPGGWGLYNLIEVGAYPQPISARKFPGQCS